MIINIFSKIGAAKMKCVASYFYRVDDDNLKWKELGEIPMGFELNDSDFKMINCTSGNITK